MIAPGDVISYLEMCREEGTNLQKGMQFRLRGSLSVILMNQRPGAPYPDRVEENGQVLIYEGHDVPASSIHPNPKLVDQPLFSRSGKPTQNGLFFKAAGAYKASEGAPELVKVYEKITRGIWVYCGVFELVGAWQEQSNARQVFKFKLRLRDDSAVSLDQADKDVEHNRLIPTAVKLEVWKRDKGKCVKCGSRDNLHFDHVIPYSKGGSSLVSDNIQILCARHNLEKKDRIE